MRTFLKRLTSRQHSDFFDLLDAQSQIAIEAATLFSVLVNDFSHMPEHLKKLEKVEHEADKLVHQLSRKIHTQFLTPLDKEDMYALSDSLDNITDTIEAAAARLSVYHLTAPRADLDNLVNLIVGITRDVQKMIALLRQGFPSEPLTTIIADIHAVESESDRSFRQAMSTLFADTSLEARQFIAWKEIYERVEKAVNQCEKVAGLVETLMVKYG